MRRTSQTRSAESLRIGLLSSAFVSCLTMGLRKLPMLQATKENIPVVVAGNKLDLRSGDAHSIESELRNAAAPIMESFSIVETCIDCSAKRMINIPEVRESAVL